LSYTEHRFNSSPGLESSFEAPLGEMSLGWDFIFNGHHGLLLDFELAGTLGGEEEWEEFGVPVQRNDLQVGRIGLVMGYSLSTWNRALAPEEFPKKDQILRLAGGLNTFYRNQTFWRTDFLLLDSTPPATSDISVRETFDMFGAELVVDLEIGPRPIASAFLRGRFGGEFVTVLNNSLPYRVDPADARINTAGIHGRVEVGVVSQPHRNLELRLGYRYYWQEVFGSDTVASGFDPGLGPVDVLIELPDNTTEIHMAFIEVSIPFSTD